MNWDEKPTPPEYGIIDELKFVALGFALSAGLSLLVLLVVIVALGGLY